MLGHTLSRARSLLHRFVHPDGDEAIKALGKEIRQELRRLSRRLEQLDEAQRTAAEQIRQVERTSRQLTMVAVLDRQQQQEVDGLATLLDETRVAEHVRKAVAAAQMCTDPYEHIIVDRVLPEPLYELLVRAIPPAEFFDDRDPIKQNVVFPMDFGPRLSIAAWEYMDDVIARRVIRPIVLEKFHDALQRHFASTFGPELVDRANALPQSASGGRLMLRRPGYHLGPHRDPKRVMLTCLLYLARSGDDEAHGTQIFRVIDDSEADYKQTYYPEEEGRRCELVKTVPFRPNTMLVSLNSLGAHGATIPADAPQDLERYTYQFYVAAQREALAALIKSLPPPKRALWQDKAKMKAEYA